MKKYLLHGTENINFDTFTSSIESYWSGWHNASFLPSSKSYRYPQIHFHGSQPCNHLFNFHLGSPGSI